jgi:hypothetical protein
MDKALPDNQPKDGVSAVPAAASSPSPAAPTDLFSAASPKKPCKMRLRFKIANWSKAIKFIYPITIALIVLILTWLMSFLYNNVYLTMTQAETVSSLKSRVIEEKIDFAKFNAITAKIKTKGQAAAAPAASSPFEYGARTTAAPIATTTPTVQ